MLNSLDAFPFEYIDVEVFVVLGAPRIKKFHVGINKYTLPLWRLHDCLTSIYIVSVVMAQVYVYKNLRISYVENPPMLYVK